MGSRSYVLLGIVALAIGYFSYVEFPEQCDFPILMKIYYSLLRLVTNASYAWHYLGGSYVAMMRSMEFDFSPTIQNVKITKHTFGGVRTTIFSPLSDQPKDNSLPAIIFYHGGGWAVGSVELYGAFAKSLAKFSGMMVIFPEYRLAPEHPYPNGLQDCISATLDFIKQAAKFRVDKNKILFMGDSAGGNLAVAVSLSLAKRDFDHMKPCHMTLVYPLLQMSNFQLPSYKKNDNAPLVTREISARFVLLYMGIENFTALVPPITHNMHMKDLKTDGFANKIKENLVPQKYKANVPEISPYQPSKYELAQLEKYRTTLLRHFTDPLFAPLSAKDEDLKLLSKTLIITSEFDVLRDDGLILSERMKSLGLDVTYKNLEYAAHGILNLFGMVDYDKFDKSMKDMISEVKHAAENC